MLVTSSFNLLGSIVIADENLSPDRMLTYLKASVSVPGFFPPVIERNSSLVDGSTIASADIPEVIDRCRTIVNDDKDIILDVIMVQEGWFIFNY